jgi:hypothetical protein
VSFVCGGRIFKMKKSFIIYVDTLDILDELNTEQIANLFLAIKAHHKGEHFELDALTRVALKPFLIQWERDLEKWERIADMRRAQGSKGGQAKASKMKQKLANGSKSQNELANSSKSSVSVSVSDSVSDSESDINKKTLQKKFLPPSLEEVKQWFIEQGSTAEAGAKAWQYYTDGNWCDAKGQPVKNWRQKMRGGRWLETKATQPTSNYRPLERELVPGSDILYKYNPHG